MRDLLAWVFAALFALGGMLVWFGRLRIWEKPEPDPPGMPPPRWEETVNIQWLFGLPWLSVLILFAGAVAGLRALGVEVPDLVVRAVVVACGVLALGAMTVRWPRWATPPWYRQAQERFRRADGKQTRGRGRTRPSR